MTDTTPKWLAHDETAGTVTITLSRPFVVDGQERAALKMREPTVADQKVAATAGSSIASELRLFANLLELTEADIERMRLRDYTRVQAAYRSFID
jgi:hypothetical protein